MAIENLLGTLLQDLMSVGNDHEELFDSEVRQIMGNAVMDGFVRGQGTGVVSTELGMFSDEANRLVYAALVKFIENANAAAESLGMTAFFDRLAALQDRHVVTNGSYDYDEFFGHTPPEFYDESGNVIRTQ